MKTRSVKIYLIIHHYTRPVDYKGMKVPDVLLTGHHKNIEKWRYAEAIKRTAQRRPDLLEKMDLTDEDIAIIGKE